MTAFEDLKAAIEKDDRAKWDAELLLNTLRLNPAGEIYRYRNHPAQLTQLALSQLCQRIVPRNGANFVSHAPLSLRIPILNHYLAQQRNMSLIRGKGRVIRAILSQDYMVYNNADLLNALEPIVATNNAEIRDCYLDVNSFWLTLSMNGIRLDSFGGLVGGVRLGNSEVGLRSLVCYALVWREICSNGLMGWNPEELFRKVHRGKLSATELSAGLANAISAALNQARSLIDRLVQTEKEPVNNPVMVIERIAKKRGFSHEFRDTMLGILMREPRSSSLFGLVNAMTQAAHLYAGDRRIMMEREAGRLLNWQQDEIYSQILM